MTFGPKMKTAAILLAALAGIFLLVGFAFDRLFEMASDQEDVFNNTGEDITIYPVTIPSSESREHLVKIGKGSLVPKNSSKKIGTDCLFIIEIKGQYFKYPVGFIPWYAEEGKDYGDFNDRVYQLEPDRKLFILKHQASRPLSTQNLYQPKGYPLKPERVAVLQDFHISMAPDRWFE